MLCGDPGDESEQRDVPQRCAGGSVAEQRESVTDRFVSKHQECGAELPGVTIETFVCVGGPLC